MILYFSGTGNSFSIAKWWAKKTGDRITDISNCRKNKTFYADTDTLFLTYPVYYYDLPNIVEETLSQMDFSSVKKCVVVQNCGCMTGLAGEKIRKLLKTGGLPVDYLFDLVMPENYLLAFNPPKEIKVQKILKRAEKSLEEFYRITQEEKPGRYYPVLGPFPKLIHAVTRPFYDRGCKTKKFWADGNCIACGICAKLCPVEAIETKEGKPVWVKDQCVHCLACISNCPVEALQYGKRTKHRRRYVHPEYRIAVQNRADEKR